MKTGVSYPSHRGATFTLDTGMALADFPVTNLANLESIRRVFKANAGPVSITYELATLADVEFLCLLHHNAEVTATYRHRLYDETDAVIYDSGVLPFYPDGMTPITTFLSNTPHLLPLTNAAAGRLDLSSHTTGWTIGGLEVAGFWLWPDVGVERDFGLKNNDVVIRAVEGADHAMSQFKPRVVGGMRDNVDATVEEETILRFQRAYGLRKPFVFVWDYDDPETWQREVILVRNESIPTFKRKEWPAGAFSFRLLEHLR